MAMRINLRSMRPIFPLLMLRQIDYLKQHPRFFWLGCKEDGRGSYSSYRKPGHLTPICCIVLISISASSS